MGNCRLQDVTNSMKNIYLLTIICMIVGSSCDNKQSHQSEKDIGQVKAAADWREEDANRYMYVKGDFDGDGRLDSAELLRRDSEHALGLFVFKGDNPGSALLLEEISDVGSIERVGVRVVLPGLYKTACGKGYRDCQPGEPKQISITNQAIDLFLDGSANSYYIWDIHDKKFNRVWISD